MLMRYISLSVQILVLYSFMAPPAHAEKTDIVVLINGNAVTGEIKSLDFGSLRYSTDSMGTVSIDWEDIVNVTSSQNFQIEVVDGSRYYGHLTAPEDRYAIRLKTPSTTYDFQMAEVIRITPIESDDSFWEQLDGSFSIGLQTAKSTEITTSSVSGDVNYRTRKYLLGLRLTSNVTDQPSDGEPGTGTTARQTIQANYQRFKGKRWFTDWFTSWEKNDELGIESRLSLGGALGRFIVQTNQNQLSITAGAQAARERFTGDDEPTTKPEGRIEIRYLRRKLVPETSITFTTKIYPSLEDWGSYRAETDLSLTREFVEDLFFDITVGYSYLSDPPTDAESADYTITTSLGYSF